MTLIINIPEEEYNHLKRTNDYSLEHTRYIRDGVPFDKMRAEIEEKYGGYDICEWFDDYDYEENDISEYRSVGNVSDILEIIDKYRAERGDKK